MAFIKYYEKNIEIQTDTILFIKTYDMMLFYSDLLTKKMVINDSVDILNEHRSLIISPLTKLGDLFSFKKNNILGKEIFENHNELFRNLINADNIHNCKEKLSEYLSDINENDDIDILKLIQVVFNVNFDKLIDKKSFLTLINLLPDTSLSNLLIFNCEWLDEECISKIVSSNIKCVIVFNDYANIKKYIVDNINNVLIVSNKNISIFDHKLSKDEETVDDFFNEKMFIKL